ncbi:hypothetical protein N7520_000030 [Penicillium odoratum]|uniref:uncharacterized protein n=1 Tax=Penicillium odoratum TaxID=1167516 RepID=UPI002547EC1F|nr:uncharacterized protein N7520_000030 [Penicillium odoratum]KAJ5776784.1 hypothetical protein N7520_000030 [Penicillium odoratum]
MTQKGTRAQGSGDTATPITTPLLLTAAKATLREQTIEACTREWTTSTHGEYVRDLFPGPTKAVFRLHEPLRRPTSAALIQMQAGKLALPAYLATIATWPEVARTLLCLRVQSWTAAAAAAQTISIKSGAPRL